MNICLIGAGSIGGILAVLLHKNGFAPDIVVNGEEKAELIKKEGYYLTGLLGDVHENLSVYSSVDALEKKYDVCLIATKYQQMPGIASSMIPHLTDDALVVSVQNGNCLESLSEVVGAEHSVGAMISFSATLLDVNKDDVTAMDKLVIGMPNGHHPAKLDELAGVLNTIIPTHVSDDIVADLYAKIIFNSCINAIAAVSDTTVGHMMDTKIGREAMLNVMREGANVTAAMGIDVPHFNLIPKYSFFAKHNGKVFNAVWGRIMQISLRAKSGNVIPSTLQSLRKGRITEIDIMNGHLATMGEKYGVPTPTNSSLTKIIKEIESGQRALSKDNIKDVIV